MDMVECPYCGAENEINDLFEKRNEFDWTCEECDGEFCVTVEYEPQLYADKIVWQPCEACHQPARCTTSTDLFVTCPEHLIGKQICDSCIRAELGYR